MNPKLKKLIIIINITAYAVVCLFIFVRRKGGFKALLPHKKYTMQEIADMRKKGVVPPGTANVKVRALEKQVPQAPTAAPQQPAAKQPKVQAPAPKAAVPAAAVKQSTQATSGTQKLLKELQAKELAQRFDYSSRGRRDPLAPAVGIEKYFGSIKFTPDDMADYTSGFSREEMKNASPFTLNGTIKSKNGESSVVINNQILQLNDVIDGYKVVSIDRRSVKLSSGKRTITLDIPVDKTQTETSIMKRLEAQEKEKTGEGQQ